MSEELERAAETSGQMLARLGIDGKLWADEFCNLTGFKDHGWALSWFCNAIMAGHDQAHASRDAEVAELKNTLERTQGQLDHNEKVRIELRARIKELEESFAKLKEIAANMQSMPPEFAKIVDEKFWELLA